ncbi:discoidin domain-containing protein [Bacteroidota bacterium]
MKIKYILLISISLLAIKLKAQDKKQVYPGADEKTPSLSQYFSWINNTNEGSTEAQTLANLDFFKWLHDDYGMILDIYVVSAGAIDKGRWYGSMESDEFKTQFPNGFEPIYLKAKEMGTRLGTWGGPDGFGNTAKEEQKRIDMIVKLCKDYEFRLLKFDAVVGQLRDEKQEAFIRMMTECRKYSPDLIFLNHRLNLSEEARKHATTSLWGGVETYIDVHMPNWKITAPHHRASALSRDVVPGLIRLTEDHGVCLSSCLDYWEDDLVLQAFNRSLILSPQLYGNPWFLKDDEYPKLARIFNLARKYGDILVEGIVLPENIYGLKAVSRGDNETRLITLRNLEWDKKSFNLTVNEEIGVSKDQMYEIRVLHPIESIIGEFRFGESIQIDVDPFRSALVLVSQVGQGGLGIHGCDYEIVQDVEDKYLVINLMGFPGESKWISLDSNHLKFKNASIDGVSNKKIINGKKIRIDFPGDKLSEEYYRKIGELKECEVPADAEALYESTVFAADNNALEIRSLKRSGSSKIPAVNAAREAFLEQPLFSARGLWDKYMFDGNEKTAFYVDRRNSNPLINRGALRIDFGQIIQIDELVIQTGDEHGLQPWKFGEAASLEISADLENWKAISTLAGPEMKIKLDSDFPIRYIRFSGTPDKIKEIKGFLKGEELTRENWSGSNLFSHYKRFKADAAWSTSTIINEIHPGTYLAVALDGEHGIEGAYAAIRVDGKPIGSPDRSPSYPCNAWEYPVARTNSHYTYYIPLTKEMEGKNIEIFVLGMKGGVKKFKPCAYLTCYPKPYKKMQLRLYR